MWCELFCVFQYYRELGLIISDGSYDEEDSDIDDEIATVPGRKESSRLTSAVCHYVVCFRKRQSLF